MTEQGLQRVVVEHTAPECCPDLKLTVNKSLQAQTYGEKES
jgi:hypothetical protein